MLEVTLRCRFQHTFTCRPQRVDGTGNTQCPACRRGGVRTSVKISKRAVAEARAAAGLGGPGQAAPVGELEAERARLAELWSPEHEPPAAAPLADLEGDAGCPCPKCGGPRYWAGAHTVVVCPACRIKDTSPGAKQREAEHAAARTRARQASQPTAPDRAEQRAARVALRKRKELLRAGIGELERTADPDAYDHVQDRTQALTLGAELRGYLPEIDGAEDDGELEDIARELAELRGRADVRALETAAVQTRQRRELAREQQQYQQQAERQQRAELEARQRQAALAQQRPRAALPPAATRPPTPGQQAAATAQSLGEFTRSMIARRRQLERNGPCPFHWRKDTPATRLYRPDLGQFNWQQNGLPEKRACAKHHKRAELALGELGYARVRYWELT